MCKGVREQYRTTEKKKIECVSTCVSQLWSTFLSHKGQGPGEDVHEVGQPVGVRRAVELTDVHHVVLILQHRR